MGFNDAYDSDLDYYASQGECPDCGEWKGRGAICPYCRADREREEAEVERREVESIPAFRRLNDEVL